MFLRLVVYILIITFSVVKANNNNSDTITNNVTPNSRAQFLQIGINGGWFSVRDYATSPLIYRGFLPGPQIGFSLEARKMEAWLNFDFSYGKQTTRNYPETDANSAKAYNNYLNLTLARKFNIGNWTKTKLLVGGNLELIANFRDNLKFNNANFNWEGFGAVGPMILFQKTWDFRSKQINMGLFRWPFRERTIKISTSFSVPMITAVSRPLYATISDFVDGISPTFSMKDLKYASFHTFFNIDSHTRISYFLHNGNRLLFSYHWYYYNYHPADNKVSGVAGLFSLSFLFRLNKK